MALKSSADRTCIIPYGGIGIIRAWTENGFLSVPLYILISDEVDDWDYGHMEQVDTFEDQTAVFVYSEMETKWGMYVQVDRAGDYDDGGWVSILDVGYPVQRVDQQKHVSNL